MKHVIKKSILFIMLGSMALSVSVSARADDFSGSSHRRGVSRFVTHQNGDVTILLKGDSTGSSLPVECTGASQAEYRIFADNPNKKESLSILMTTAALNLTVTFTTLGLRADDLGSMVCEVNGVEWFVGD